MKKNISIDNNTLTEKSQSLTKIYSQHCEKLQKNLTLSYAIVGLIKRMDKN